ncbi:MAG TPA: carbohydrate ABC transporter permease [Solirubrobacteraceae bacterium]|nr:carbohydrate ABC transporter permease [Solirubrobacteraceae bacterium]
MAGVRSRGWAIAAIAVSALFLAPLLFMVTGSLRGIGEPPPRGLELLPPAPGLDGYERAFTAVPLARALWNSLALALLAVPLAVLTASTAGFAIARAGARARRVALAVVLALLVVPVSALWVPRFVMWEAVGLQDTWIPLLAPALMGGSPLLVLLYVYAFRRLPSDTLDAARVEGAGPWRLWRTVAMPLVQPTTVAVGLLAFAFWWSAFSEPLLYLHEQDEQTAPLALRSLQQLGRSEWPAILAGATVVTAPVAVAFALALRRIVPRRGSGWLGG